LSPHNHFIAWYIACIKFIIVGIDGLQKKKDTVSCFYSPISLFSNFSFV
jgi:hypothetical protein